MTAPPMADCTSDATRGDDDRGEVRPRARGSTPSRPRENMYRATVLWKDTVAATMLVISSTWVRFTTAGPSWAPARPKITSVSCAWEMPTIWSVRSEEHTSELQSRGHLVCRLLPENKTNSTT